MRSVGPEDTIIRLYLCVFDLLVVFVLLKSYALRCISSSLSASVLK